MGNYKKHLQIAREKLKAVRDAFDKGLYTVVGDIATKVVEQLIEADAARENIHFGTHRERHQFSGKRYPDEINAVPMVILVMTVLMVTGPKKRWKISIKY
jgi:hypothetical protein